MADNIQKNDIVAIETLKGELVGAGNSLLNSNEILEADSNPVDLPENFDETIKNIDEAEE